MCHPKTTIEGKKTPRCWTPPEYKAEEDPLPPLTLIRLIPWSMIRHNASNGGHY